MTWTSQYPTQPGYYWIRNWTMDVYPDKPEWNEQMAGPDIGEVNADLEWLWPGSESDYGKGDFLSAEWLGPISPPQQPDSCPVIGHSAACNCHHGDNAQYIRPISPPVEDK